MHLFSAYGVSAKQQAPGTRSPQSEYVRLLHNGTCIWWPMYEESVSHCPINVTWFPFDDQRCCLVYESWKYNASQISISSAVLESGQDYQFRESEQWQLMGVYKHHNRPARRSVTVNFYA